MKKFKKTIIIIISAIVVLLSSTAIIYHYFYEENQLNIKEKEWIENNKANLIDISVPNQLNIFAKDGNGVFFDFIEGFEKNYDISFNKIVKETSTINNNIGFYVNKDITNNDLFIYKDYFVVLSLNPESISNYNDFTGSTIGLNADTLSRITSSYKNNVTYKTLETREELLTALDSGTIKYLIVPKNEYLNTIIEKGYTIVYHLSDIPINYFLRLGSDEVLNSIIVKYYNLWFKEEYEELYYDYAYNLFVNNLNLTQAETDALTNKTYKFGFVESTPYTIKSGRTYGGIITSYLTEFTKLSNTEFKYIKYKKYDSLIKDFNNSKLDLVFDNTKKDLEHHNIFTNLNNKYYIVSPFNRNLNISNLSDLPNESIVVLKDSKIDNFLGGIPEIKVETVSNEKKLLKSIKRNKLVALDSRFYDYYINNKIKEYNISTSGYIKDNYSFKYINNSDAFYKLFKAYANTLDDKEMANKGIITYNLSAKNSNVLSIIAKYLLIILSLLVIIIFIIFKSKNKMKLDTKIKKDEKLKFVDLLTSLKNRNYLNEKKDAWNNNTIYPQAVIMIDLNNVKYLNDTFGHQEGDKQIKAAANILIKTQLDNTEIIRTDGNEFMVYLVNYSEKQVLNYIKKLVKEFKKLPYEYGASIGFDMIVDDLKLIDDAINEATIKMRENKENLKNQDENEG